MADKKNPKINSLSIDLSPLFQNDDDPNMKINRKKVAIANYNFINKWKNRTDYLKNPKILKKALDEYELLHREFGTGGGEDYYFLIKTQIDQNNTKIKARFNQIEDISLKIYNDLQFFELNLSKIPPKTRSRFLKSKELKEYEHFLERIFAWSNHLLSEKEERILNLQNVPAHQNWIDMVEGFLSKEEREILINGKKTKQNFSQIMSLINSQDKKIRDTAAKALNDIFIKNIEVAEKEINSILANKKIVDELRQLPRPDSARHLSDDIDTDIVDTLINTVSNNQNLSKRYYKLKSKLLKLPKLEYHERNVEIGIVNKKYSYDDSVKLVNEVFFDLDPEYSELFTKFVENSQIDVYPKNGKRGGAACFHNLWSEPSYIFLNHTDRLVDVTTLAHEVGHGIQNEMIKTKQNSLNFGTPLSIAEVGSQFLEDFVLEELMKRSDDKERLKIQMTKLNDDISAIFRQVACYKFEQELHRTFREKGYLSYQEIGQIFQKHMFSYMGPAVEKSEGSENWWVYWSHIRTFFYVYSYASGLLISKSMQASVRKDKNFIVKVKQFQNAGTSLSPKEIFKNMGIDITQKYFWEQGIKEIQNLLTETEKLAKKLGEI